MRSRFPSCVLALVAASSAASASTLDSFETVDAWRALPAQGVELRLSLDTAGGDSAMRLDFDFQGHGGYAIARRDAPVDLPDNFELAFRIRAEAPVNTLEVKLVDETGDNVWWTTRRDWDFPREWRRMSLKKRNFEFAWGPAGPSPLPDRIGAIEIVVTAGTGGRGTVWVDDLSLEPLEPPSPAPLPLLGPWSAEEGGARQVTFDLGGRHELGGAVIEWGETFATRYTVSASLDGERWDAVQRIDGANGGRDWVHMPDTDARWIRLDLEAGRGDGFAIRGLTLKPADWGRTANEFFAGIARESARGDWPRHLAGEQSYWTVVGSDGGSMEALVGEDGAVELGDARVSLEPFVRLGDRTLTWADVTATQSLVDGVLPIPRVEWSAPGVRLTITAFVTPDDLLRIRYQLTAPDDARLVLAIRPVQVNPPWQFLNRVGGISRIDRLSWDGTRLTVGSAPELTITPRTSARFGALAFHAGNVVDSIRAGVLPSASSVDDPTGWASGALAFDHHDVTIDVPLGALTPSRVPSLADVAASWHAALGDVVIDLPDKRISESIRANLGWILVNRDGPSIQPGARSYDRSWIRDGSLTSAALLRLGHEAKVREFIEWYATHQYPDGRIPCCVSATGADPVPEHDSHGQFIFLVAEYLRFTGDRDLARRMWPRVEKTVEAIDALRRERMTPEYEAPDKRVFFGLMPESISHEGYSAKPMHSYWDDLFALRGLEDAAWLAGELGLPDESARIGAIRDEFRGHFRASMELAMQQHGIGYVPGCAELGDFDATSTTVFLSPGATTGLDPQALERTFEAYWENFVARRNGTLDWENYTPYELRVVGALVRLGRRDRALEALDFFLHDRRPAGWRHWAEVVWKDARKGAFIGDMPHGWVASDFIRSAIDLVAHERESDSALVLAAGVPAAWVEDGRRVRVENLRTHHGRLSYTMERHGSGIVVRIRSGVTVPPGGIVVVSPFDGSETVVRDAPAEIVLTKEPR
jgi:hypothetical protein